MSLELYDKSMIDKLKSVFGNVVYAPTDEALSRANDDTKGSVQLPLISVYRLDGRLSTESGFLSMPEHATGRWTRSQAQKGLLTQSLPMDVVYQIDIWSVERVHADSIYSELLFYLIDQPNLSIDLPNLCREDFAMTITDTQSEIDMESFKDRGRLYRNTITLEGTVRVYRQQELDIKTVEFSLDELQVDSYI